MNISRKDPVKILHLYGDFLFLRDFYLFYGDFYFLYGVFIVVATEIEIPP